MIQYYEGTVFNTGAKALVNTINTVGVMGAGIALEFALRYPNMLEDYKAKCKDNKLIVGKVDYFKLNDEIIVNFPTKWHFKYPSKLKWIELGLNDFVNTYRQNNIHTIAFPRLGCSNGGLDWQEVRPLMEKYLSNLDIQVFICLDKLPYAEGKEKQMVDLFNDMSIVQLSQKIKLTQKQITSIENIKPISRFWHLGEIQGIGMKTYTNIFNLFYLNTDEANSEQLSLF